MPAEIMEAGKHDRIRKCSAPERPGILADGNGRNAARAGERALCEEPQIRRGRDQDSWPTETSPGDAKPGTTRFADHGAARLRQAGRNPHADRCAPCRPYRCDPRLL